MVVQNRESSSFLLVSLLLLVGCIEFVDCAKPKVISTTKGEEFKFQSFPVGQEKETAENIIRFQYTIAEPLRNIKHFQQPLLAYITPWYSTHLLLSKLTHDQRSQDVPVTG